MTILVDISQVMHANYYVMKNFTDNIANEAFYQKVVNHLGAMLKVIQVAYPKNKLIICADSESFRKKIYSQYKANRLKKDDFTELADYCLNKLKQNYYFAQAEGLEADDIINILAKNEKFCIIISNDKDLYQIDMPMFGVQKKAFIDYTFKPIDLIVKIVKGEKTDNIPCLVSHIDKLKKDFPWDPQRLTPIELSELLFDYYKDKFFLNKKAQYLQNIELVVFDEITYKKYLPNFKQICQELILI